MPSTLMVNYIMRVCDARNRNELMEELAPPEADR
jgi:hypothetical protein